MKIVFAIIGLRNLIEEEVKSGEKLKAVIARIAQTLHVADQADMIHVYKAVHPFEKADSAVKKLQKGSFSAHNLQSVSRKDTVTIQACATDKVHFVLDVPIRNDSIFFWYAKERRYFDLAYTRKRLAMWSLLISLLCRALARIAFPSAFGVVGGFCLVFTVLAGVSSCAFEWMSMGKCLLKRDIGEDGSIIIDSDDDST